MYIYIFKKKNIWVVFDCQLYVSKAWPICKPSGSAEFSG